MSETHGVDDDGRLLHASLRFPADALLALSYASVSSTAMVVRGVARPGLPASSLHSIAPNARNPAGTDHLILGSAHDPMSSDDTPVRWFRAGRMSSPPAR